MTEKTDLAEVNTATLERYGIHEEDRILARQVRKFASWARGKYPMTDDEILASCIRARQMGVHPLNDKAFQAYKDSHGIHLDYHYSLISKWVSQFLKVRHTAPRYYRLTDEQLEFEGLSETDVAYYAKFILNEDLDDYYRMMDKLPPDEAYDMFAVTGIGVTDKSTWNSQYFAPNGRSKAWKLQKRALKDAYVRKFGYPSPAEARFMQEQLGWVDPDDDDVNYGAQPVDISDESRVALMQSHAKLKRLPAPTISTDEAKSALFGNDAVDAELVEPPAITDADVSDWMEEQKNAPDPEPETPADFIDCVEFGVFTTKSGKMHIGFMEDGQKWPDVRWWKGRDEFLQAAPWTGVIASKDDLGIDGRRFSCNMRVFFEENEHGYKNATRFEMIED